VSGVYLAFPNPFQNVVDYLQPSQNLTNEVRFGDEFLRWLSRLHFGRFGGWPVKALWTVLGLIPVVLFITGAVMWWNRVLRPALLGRTVPKLELGNIGVLDLKSDLPKSPQ